MLEGLKTLELDNQENRMVCDGDLETDIVGFFFAAGAEIVLKAFLGEEIAQAVLDSRSHSW